MSVSDICYHNFMNDKNAALLDLCERIGKHDFSINGVLKMQEYFVVRVKQALAGGADPACRHKSGNDCMQLLSCGPYSQAALKAAKFLIDAGYPAADRSVLTNSSADLVKGLSEYLNRKMGDGETFVSRHGNHVLHGLCATGGTDVLRVALHLLSKGKPIHLISQDTLNAQNRDGDTPVHLLWRQPKVPKVFHQSNRWFAMEALNPFNPDLSVRNQQGVAVWDEIARVAEGLGDQMKPEYHQVWAPIQAARLDAATQASSQPASRGPRL